MLFFRQRACKNPFASEDFEQRYTEILCRQRYITDGPGRNSPYAGNQRHFNGISCPLEPLHDRCPAASPLAERFRFLCMVNAPYAIPPSTRPIEKTAEQKQKIRTDCTKSPSRVVEITRKVLQLEPYAPLSLYFEGNFNSAASMSRWALPHGHRLHTALSKRFPAEQGELHKHWEALLEMFASTPESQWKKKLPISPVHTME